MVIFACIIQIFRKNFKEYILIQYKIKQKKGPFVAPRFSQIKKKASRLPWCHLYEILRCMSRKKSYFFYF